MDAADKGVHKRDRLVDDLRMKGFRDSTATREAHALTLAIYTETRPFPDDERFGLTSQLRRAAASVGGNLAEGIGRAGPAEFARHVSIALGSCEEVAYFLLLSHDLGHLDEPTYTRLTKQTANVGRILSRLRRALQAAANPGK